MKKKSLAILTAFALLLTLLTACGGQSNEPQQPSEPAPTEDTAPVQKDEPAPAPAPDPVPETDPEPAADPAPAETETPSDTTDPDPEPKPEPEPEPEPEPAPEPDPAPASDPESETEGESIMAGDTYTISVKLEGGSGRATVESPAMLHYKGLTCWATIVWSSPNFDYMKVDGQRYDPINTEGNSTFEIPVSAFDQPIPVIADTIAMSEPHEVEYTLTFDYSTMEDA